MKFENLSQSNKMYGRTMLQSHAAIAMYEEILNSHEINWIIEIGTATGMLSLYFATYSRLNGSQFLTIDSGAASWTWPCEEDTVRILVDLGAHVLHDDCFKAKDTICKFMKGKGLLFLDGGHKAKELAIFSTCVPVDSIIIAHDYPQEITSLDIDLCKEVERYEPYNTESLSFGTKAVILRRIM